MTNCQDEEYDGIEAIYSDKLSYAEFDDLTYVMLLVVSLTRK